MALPNDTLSSQVFPADFFGGRNDSLELDEDHETGGIALNDASQGLLVQVWTTSISGNFSIITQAPAVSPITLYTGAETITEVSLTFDQSMRQTFAFVEGGVAKLDWFDTSVSARVLTEYPDIQNPRVSLDDKRRLQSGLSDIIFSYIKDGNLYYRQQRDRYLTERLLASNVLPTTDSYLRRTGMNLINRFQFEIFRPWSQEEKLAFTLSQSADPVTSSSPDVGTTSTIFSPSDSTIWSQDNNTNDP